jgi:hypothetical protein
MFLVLACSATSFSPAWIGDSDDVWSRRLSRRLLSLSSPKNSFDSSSDSSQRLLGMEGKIHHLGASNELIHFSLHCKKSFTTETMSETFWFQIWCNRHRWGGDSSEYWVLNVITGVHSVHSCIGSTLPFIAHHLKQKQHQKLLPVPHRM